MQGGIPRPSRGRHVVFFNWRDTSQPRGRRFGALRRGDGARARASTAHGPRSSAPPTTQAPADEVVDGVRYVRRGDHLGDLPARRLEPAPASRFGKVDLVVDVQNGLPFFTRLATRAPVVVLVHHVHREQWPVVFPGLLGRVGWWIERSARAAALPPLASTSRCPGPPAPSSSHSASTGTASRSSTTAPRRHPAVDAPRSPAPALCVLGRLVPHKQVEHAIDAVVALRADPPRRAPRRRRQRLVGGGPAHSTSPSAGAERRRDVHRARQRATQARDPGPVVADAAALAQGGLGHRHRRGRQPRSPHRSPTRRPAGRASRSPHGAPGLLVDTPAEFTERRHARLVEDDEERERLGAGAREMSHTFSWDALAGVVRPRPDRRAGRTAGRRARTRTVPDEDRRAGDGLADGARGCRYVGMTGLAAGLRTGACGSRVRTRVCDGTRGQAASQAHASSAAMRRDYQSLHVNDSSRLGGEHGNTVSPHVVHFRGTAPTAPCHGPNEAALAPATPPRHAPSDRQRPAAAPVGVGSPGWPSGSSQTTVSGSPSWSDRGVGRTADERAGPSPAAALRRRGRPRPRRCPARPGPAGQRPRCRAARQERGDPRGAHVLAGDLACRRRTRTSLDEVVGGR